MFMISKADLLWRDVERARRVRAIQSGMDTYDVWKKANIFDAVKDAEDKFAREIISVYADLREYCCEMEKIAYAADEKIAAMQRELNLIKETPTSPKKPRKPRAKKAK